MALTAEQQKLIETVKGAKGVMYIAARLLGISTSDLEQQVSEGGTDMHNAWGTMRAELTAELGATLVARRFDGRAPAN